MSKKSIKLKRQKESELNQYRIENYGACPHCGKGFLLAGADASFCFIHGWVVDKTFISHKLLTKQRALNYIAVDLAA